MIGRKECSKDHIVLSKIETLKLDDIYEIPQVFQVSCTFFKKFILYQFICDVILNDTK